MTDSEALKRFVELDKEVDQVRTQIKKVCIDFLTKSNLSYDDIGDMSVSPTAVSVERIFWGRRGGEDNSKWYSIPTEYFSAETDEGRWDVIKKIKEEEALELERKKAEEAKKLQVSEEDRDKKEYERLKKKFEGV